jgi:hypothetical protein
MARARKGGGRRTLRDLQEEAAAAEAKEKVTAEDEEEEDEGEEEAAAEAEEGEEGDEEAPKPKKKKAPAAKKPAAKKPAAKRVRTPKEVRTRAVWVVFDNASKRVDTFPYNQKAEAEALLARKQEEKKGTFYLNLVKEEIKE